MWDESPPTSAKFTEGRIATGSRSLLFFRKIGSYLLGSDSAEKLIGLMEERPPVPLFPFLCMVDSESLELFFFFFFFFFFKKNFQESSYS